MSKELNAYYSMAEKLGGFKAKMRFTLITGITEKKAEKLEETQQNLNLFKSAFKEIEKEYK